MRRRRMSRKSSRRAFSRGAKRSHRKNRMDARVMRGGIRL